MSDGSYQSSSAISIESLVPMHGLLCEWMRQSPPCAPSEDGSMVPTVSLESYPAVWGGALRQSG